MPRNAGKVTPKELVSLLAGRQEGVTRVRAFITGFAEPVAAFRVDAGGVLKVKMEEWKGPNKYTSGLRNLLQRHFKKVTSGEWFASGAVLVPTAIADSVERTWGRGTRHPHPKWDNIVWEEVKEPTRAEEPAKSHAEGAAQAVPGASSQAQSQPQSQPVPLSTSSNQPPAQASSSEQAHTPAQQHPPPDLPLATSSRAGGRHADGGATRSTIVGIVGIAVGESSCSLLRVPGIIWDGAQALSQGEAGASAPAASKEAGSLACWKAPAASTSDSAAAASAPVAACAADGEDTEEEADEDSTPLFGGNGVMAKVSGTESISGRKRCHDTMIAEDSGNS